MYPLNVMKMIPHNFVWNWKIALISADGTHIGKLKIAYLISVTFWKETLSFLLEHVMFRNQFSRMCFYLLPLLL